MTVDVNGLAQAKAVVLEHFENVDCAKAEDVSEALGRRTTSKCRFHFVHPFNEAVGAEAASDLFWKPIKKCFSPLQRRQDIFFAGRNRVDQERTVWVVSMGHLLGLFDQPFLGVRPTRQATMLRYAEFNQVEGNGIVDNTIFLDTLNFLTSTVFLRNALILNVSHFGLGTTSGARG